MSQTVELETDDQSEEALMPTEELRRLEEATNSDGTIDVEVLGWERNGDEVAVEFLHPTEGEMSEGMDWPTVADGSHKFEKVLGATGYDLAEADRLRSERAAVPASEERGEWELSLDSDATDGVTVEYPNLRSTAVLFLFAPVGLVEMIGVALNGEADSERRAAFVETTAETLPILLGCVGWTVGIIAFLLLLL